MWEGEWACADMPAQDPVFPLVQVLALTQASADKNMVHQTAHSNVERRVQIKIVGQAIRPP